MAIGSGQYNLQDPARNAGIIAQGENSDLRNKNGDRRNRKAALILMAVLIIILIAIILLFIIGST